MSTLDGMAAVRLEDHLYEVRRETREALVSVSLDLGKRREPSLRTSLAFFDHMLQMLCWYGGLTLDVTFEVRTQRLTHVICEDIGLAVGSAVLHGLRDRIEAGVESVGAAHGAIDEALAFAMLSFEGRAFCRVERRGAAANELVEDMRAADLVAFFEGFAHGARATVRLKVLEADDPHHAWEAAFRAFARALRSALTPNAWRAGLTAGVKGTLD